MVGLYILIVSIVVCLVIGILVFSKSTRDRIVVIYSSLTFALVAMSAANYLAIVAANGQIYFVRAVMIISTIAIYLVYLLVSSLRKRPGSGWQVLGFLAVTIVVAALDASHYLFQTVIPGDPPIPVPGPAIYLYFLHFFVVFSATLVLLYGMWRHAANKQQQRQYRLLIGGIVPVFTLAPLTSFVLPELLGVHQLVVLTPLYGMLFAGVVGYAVVRHGLFNVKLAAVRTTAYIMSITTMAGVYFGLAYLASVTVFKGNVTAGLSVSPINIVLALLLAFIFQPIKQFFDHWTDKIFYRDRYDTNEFITRLGNVLTSTTRLQEVLKRAGEEINATLKANGYVFMVYRDHHPDAVVGEGLRTHFDDEEYQTLRDWASYGDGHVIVVNDLERMHTQMDRHLHAVLAKRNIALVLPLVTTNDTIGYLLLGDQQGSGYGKRDINVLETIADELVITIQNARSVQVVRDMNAHLEQSVNDATRELRHSNKRLLELDATKDEFLSMASHQLRTPLTSVKGYVSMVLEGDAGEITDAQRQLLSEAFTSSERMVHLISDLLNVSRLQTGKFIIDQTQVDLADITAQEVTAIQQIANSHGMSVIYRRPERFPLLYVDDGKIRQVIMNFIDNAIYYSPESKQITVTLKVEDGDAVLCVTDKGMGVPPEEQKKLFTKFFRAENARKQRPDGTGIGLYLAKKIIDGHGGKLVFTSTLGKGSTFGFRLPIKKLSTPLLTSKDE